MGTPDFAQKSLEKIYEAGHNIIAVVTNPDRPKGRGMKMIASPVKEYAIEKNIPIYQPEKVRNNTEIIEKIKELNPEVICVVAYGKILPKEILEIPKLGCINVHGSLLPKYRGAAPIQWAVLNGDKTTGVTTMYMDEGMDTGDMILKEELEIGENETTGELWGRLSEIGGKLLVKTLEQIEKGKAPREKQGEDFTVAPMLNKEMAKIDWEEKTAREIKNLVRGLNPIMGAYSFLNGKKLKIWKIETLTNEVFMDKYQEFKEYEQKFLNTMENKRTIQIDLNTAKEWYNQGGDLRKVALQAFSENELQLPKSWEEYCKINPRLDTNKEIFLLTDGHINHLSATAYYARKEFPGALPSKERAEQFLTLNKLLQIRDYYNQGWEPDWNNVKQEKYIIGYSHNKLFLDVNLSLSHIFAFKTREIRDTFFKNFKKDLEFIKEFL
jgi:methionyl-tRNA formyltransferase